MTKNTYTITNNTEAHQGFFPLGNGDDNTFGAEPVLVRMGESATIELAGASLKAAQDTIKALGSKITISKGDKAPAPAPAPAVDETVGDLVDDTLTSGSGSDFLAAGSGDDTLTGGQGNDTISGADADDTDPRSDDELRAFILEKTGKPAHPNAKRPNLLAKVAAIPADPADTISGADGNDAPPVI